MPISLPQEASSLLRTGSHQRTMPACTRPILVGHAVELATAQHLPRRRPGPNRRLGWPSTACASFEHEAPTQAGDEPGMDAAGDHADPGHPSRTAACPTPAALQGLTSAGHSGRGNAQTPGVRTRRRHRTPDSGHLDAQTPAPDTGHWSRGQQAWTLVARTGHRTPDTGHRTPDTGHRTLAEDADKVTKARPASGPPGHHGERLRAGTPNRVLVDGACGARQPMQYRR